MHHRAKDFIKPQDGIATYQGEIYYLVDRTSPGIVPGTRIVNAVHQDALQTSPGYFPMTLLMLPKRWKRGNEVLSAIPNGEYDWVMREQRGILTPPRGYRGRSCHD